jgi:hypothetical protein
MNAFPKIAEIVRASERSAAEFHDAHYRCDTVHGEGTDTDGERTTIVRGIYCATHGVTWISSVDEIAPVEAAMLDTLRALPEFKGRVYFGGGPSDDAQSYLKNRGTDAEMRDEAERLATRIVCDNHPDGCVKASAEAWYRAAMRGCNDVAVEHANRRLK